MSMYSLINTMEQIFRDFSKKNVVLLSVNFDDYFLLSEYSKPELMTTSEKRPPAYNDNFVGSPFRIFMA